MILQLENLRERIEEESEKKSDALKQLSKSQAEIQLWRSKYETEGLGRIDELEGKILCWLGQVSLSQVKLGQIKLSQVRLG